MKKITVSLGAGESTNQIAIVGNYFRILTAPEKCTVEFSDGTKTELLAGLGLRIPKEFSNVRIQSDTAQDITFIAGIGRVDDSRVSGSIAATAQAAALNDYGKVSVTTTATNIKAANSARGSILVQPIDGAIYIGSDSSVTTANGIKVLAGGSISVTHIDAVYAIAAAGTVDVRYSEDVN